MARASMFRGAGGDDADGGGQGVQLSRNLAIRGTIVAGKDASVCARAARARGRLAVTTQFNGALYIMVFYIVRTI